MTWHLAKMLSARAEPLKLFPFFVILALNWWDTFFFFFFAPSSSEPVITHPLSELYDWLVFFLDHTVGINYSPSALVTQWPYWVKWGHAVSLLSVLVLHRWRFGSRGLDSVRAFVGTFMLVRSLAVDSIVFFLSIFGLKGGKHVRRGLFIRHRQFIDSSCLWRLESLKDTRLQANGISFTPRTKPLCSLSLFPLSDILTMWWLFLFIICQ